MAKTGSKVQTTSQGKGIYERLGNYLSQPKMFFIVLGIGAFLSLINFNARVSEAHDDSLYIEAGYRYVHEFPNYYYTANAPMYPMFLALLTLVFGTNLIVFKFFSFVFFLIGAVLYYKALNNKIPDLLKHLAFLFLCTNHLLIYYSSQTFSECFYMLIQAIFLYYFMKYNFGEKPLTGDLKSEYRQWLTLGFLMMLLTLAKNILVFGIAAIVLFFVLHKQYRKALFALVSFGIFKLLYEFVKSLVWGESAIQYKSQMGILLNKDPYDASKGQEELSGFIGRFTDNIGLYLGKRFYQILGMFSEDKLEPSYFWAMVVLAFTGYGLYRAVKDRQHAIVFLLLFAGSIAFGTFFVLQARWDQPRFIMVHMPALLIGIFYGLYRLLQKDGFNQFIFSGLMLALVSLMFINSFKRGLKNIPVLQKNLKGDIYYGYTPDWRSYLELSAWCKDNLPDTSYVACRKAPISFVYAKGKHFYPIYSVIAKDTATEQSNPDSALAIFKRNKVTHMLIASLRLNPKQNTGDIINTLHNIAAPIMRKYPDKLVPIKEIGDTEPATLFEIRY